jgi:4-diphosphocytidyl-2-C-methyl-D-erythritol kinase
MSAPVRRARIKAFAKLNLCLEVLGRRPDGYHDLRTIFQTVSLADTIDIEFTPGRKSGAVLESSVEIPGNLVLRAAEAVMEATNTRGLARFRLAKRIPMGGGLGGGSTDAAAVLLALPALTGRHLPWEQLLELGAGLGSDVPFFLMGGTALGLGRGTELYPLAGPRVTHALLVTPGLHVSTPEAFRALGRPLTSDRPSPKINVSQRLSFSLTEGMRVALAIGGKRAGGDWPEFCSNDFEAVAFRQYPELGTIKQKLKRLGARPAMMTGSGSAVFGVFSERRTLERAVAAFRQPVFPVSFLSRARYYASWWRQLGEHAQGKQWPPLSRHSG